MNTTSSQNRVDWAQPLRRAVISAGGVANTMPRWFYSRANQINIDLALSVIAVFAAFFVRFEGVVQYAHAPHMWLLALVMPLLRPLFLWIMGCYRSTWRYFGLSDLLLLLTAAAPPTVMLLALRLAFSGEYWFANIPIGAIVIEWGAFVLLALTVRGIRRFTFEAFRLEAPLRHAVLITTEANLGAAVRHVTALPDLSIIGILTPPRYLVGNKIAGLPVLGPPDHLPALLATGKADLVLIADTGVDAADIIGIATEFGVEARLLPSALDIVRGDVRVQTLPRPEMLLADRLDLPKVEPAVVEIFRDKVVLVTGAGGSIGAEICRQVARLPVARLVLLDHDENSVFEIHGELIALEEQCPLVAVVGDIRDRSAMETLFARQRPQVILHAAAFKHVPVMEANSCEAVLNNVTGTRVLVDCAVASGAERLLMISTDKAVRPSSVMGATKRVAEMLVQMRAATNGHTRLACVRFGNVIGSRGSVVPIFLRQIAAGGPITVTDEEMTRYFMTIPEAVQLVLQAAALGCDGNVYMLDMGDPVRITAMARRLIQLCGLRPDHDIEIRVVGARPGEKIHEQLWNEDARVTPTSFNRVYMVEPEALPAGFAAEIERLEAIARERNDNAVSDYLQNMPIGFAQPARSLAAAAGAAASPSA